jgi:hypothetical protein
MRTFQFTNKNAPIIIFISAKSFEEAKIILFETVKSNYGWRFDNKEEEEDE